MSRFTPIARFLPSLPLAFGSLLTIGCAETPTLFDEHGVWLATYYSIGAGEGTYEVAGNKEYGYQLAFNANQGVVAAAGCQDAEGNTSIDTSLCHFDAGSSWACRCFYYQFEESTMQWSEFARGVAAAGNPPPNGGEEGGGGSGVATINVQPAEAGSSYVFNPFPTGLFGALDGASFTFQQKSQTIWNNPPPPPKYPMEAPQAACGVCFN